MAGYGCKFCGKCSEENGNGNGIETFLRLELRKNGTRQTIYLCHKCAAEEKINLQEIRSVPYGDLIPISVSHRLESI